MLFSILCSNSSYNYFDIIGIIFHRVVEIVLQSEGESEILFIYIEYVLIGVEICLKRFLYVRIILVH